MLKRLVMGAAAVALIAALGTTAFAGDLTSDSDTSWRQGRIFESWRSTVVYGDGEDELVRTWVPLLLDDAKPYLQSSVIRIVDNRIFGGCTTYRWGVTWPRVVACFGTVDTYNFGVGLDPKGSNDIVIWENADDDVSDTVGQMLGDGRLIWRANYGGPEPQNNLEELDCDPGQQTPVPEPGNGNPILFGPGIDDTPGGSAYLGTPAAIEHGDPGNYTNVYVGVTPYDAGTLAVDNGVNIYDYDSTTPTPSAAKPADYLYTQAGAETFANLNGVPCDPGDGRQTQPIFAKVNDIYYIVFGINDTNNGGSARPGLFCVDAFEDNDAYTGAIAVLPSDHADYNFVDHQANGGGSNVYENNHFEMNSSGQLVALSEREGLLPTDPGDPPTWRVLLYNPQFTLGKITGFDAPILIADAGQFDQKPEDELAGPFYYEDPNDPNDYVVWYNSISGVGINDVSNIAFTATYDTFEPLDPNDPLGPTIWNNAAHFYDASETTLHRVLLEDDVVGRDPANPAYPADCREVMLGRISNEDSDAFFGASLADDADVLVVNFRENDDDSNISRGVAVVAVGHGGDTNFDNDVDISDLAQILGCYGTTFGVDLTYDSQCDFDLNGKIQLNDLAELLGNYGWTQ